MHWKLYTRIHWMTRLINDMAFIFKCVTGGNGKEIWYMIWKTKNEKCLRYRFWLGSIISNRRKTICRTFNSFSHSLSSTRFLLSIEFFYCVLTAQANKNSRTTAPAPHTHKTITFFYLILFLRTYTRSICFFFAALKKR